MRFDGGDMSAPGSSMSPDGEALYDQYLDASLMGEPEEPTSFFGRHPGIETAARQRIETLFGVLNDAETDDALPFEEIAGYRLLRRIGRGGMGSIYLAEQASLSRLVALKLLRPELAASRSAMLRFRREAQIIARLSHPHVVRVHELGEENDVHFIAMELVPGRTLREVFRRGRPALDRTLTWMEQCARALQAAHAEGIVHRDVKPSNILITPDDRAVLCDFGMAHLADADGTRLTQTFAGSPSYAAPEQFDRSDRHVDGRTDVYGLGASMYECLTGQLPFEGKSLEEIFQRILREDPVPPRKYDPALPVDVETIAMKAMAKRPSERYASAGELADDLRRAREHQRVRAKRPGPWARLRAWARRKPAVAAGLGVAASLAIVAVGLTLWIAHASAQQRREDAQRHFAAAQAHLDRYRDLRAKHRELIQRHGYLVERSQDRYLPAERVDELDELSAQVDDYLHEQQSLFYEALELLRSAEKLDPTLRGTDEIRARLYLERVEESIERDDHVAAELFRDLVSRHDPSGSLTRGRRESARFTLQSNPPGAQVFLFRERELHTFGKTRERRFVPVPVDGEPPAWLQHGGWALRVVEPKAPLERGDLILTVAGHPVRGSLLLARAFDGLPRGARLEGLESIAAFEELKRDEPHTFRTTHGTRTAEPAQVPVARVVDVAEEGDLPARVWRRGREIDLVLPRGATLRTTATPLLAAEPIGVTPLSARELEPGEYRVLLRHPDHADLSYGIVMKPGGAWDGRLDLPTPGPDGFVYVPYKKPFWIMEREVTCAEFLAFLRATDHPINWPRDAHGRYTIEEDWRIDWPALGVSYEDVEEYVRWKGPGYAVPDRSEWVYAALASMQRDYVFGRVWRPRWAKSCYARPRAAPEPGMRYPIDQSLFGVYDMTGSVAEWIDDWFDEERGLKRLGGSSWGFAEAQLFKAWGGNGYKPDTRSHTFGIRLIWRPEAK